MSFFKAQLQREKNVCGRRIENLIRVRKIMAKRITRETINRLVFGTKIYSLSILIPLTVFWKKGPMQIESLEVLNTTCKTEYHKMSLGMDYFPLQEGVCPVCLETGGKQLPCCQAALSPYCHDLGQYSPVRPSRSVSKRLIFISSLSFYLQLVSSEI